MERSCLSKMKAGIADWVVFSTMFPEVLVSPEVLAAYELSYTSYWPTSWALSSNLTKSMLDLEISSCNN